MSIRLRLTLLSSAILACTLIAFTAGLYFTVSQVTRNVVEDMLRDEANRLINAKEWRYDRIVLPSSKFAAPLTYVQTLSVDGEVTDRTPNLGEVILPLSDEGLAAARQGKPWIEAAEVEERRLLIYTKPLEHQGRTVGLLQVARSLSEHDQSLQAVQMITLIAGSGVVLLAFGVGWVLSGLALRPIHRITRTAQAIGAQRDFGQRVSYTGPSDELGRLATTFNAMLTELQAAYRQLEQALQAQRRFVADASHELRTPLTTIRGNLALLQREPPISAEDRVAVLSDMVDECQRLIRLVNDLLILARADVGQPLRSEPVWVRALVDDLCRQVKLLAPDRTIQCANQLDAAVIGNRDALKQVLLILLDNALKYTPPQGTITVATALDGDRVTISVRDTGPGIAPAALSQIFERFYRGDSARTGQGTGLGLAIARALVEAQRGTLSVESSPDKGSVFTVSLPREGVASEPTGPTAPPGIRSGRPHLPVRTGN